MTYRRFAWREMGWGGAAAVLASVGLAGCPGGGGGGGCPEIGGSWQVQGSCVQAPTSCEIDQDSCKITLSCSDGRTMEGTVSKSSVSFKDDEVSCSGKLDGLEDDEGVGFITPTIDAECRPEGADACDIQATCMSGDCTIPEDEDDDNGGDGDGDGDGGQGGASGVFGMSGVGGASGVGGQGGFSGQGPAGEGGFSGVGGEGGAGGIGGESGAPAGSGGIGGSVSTDCTSCAESLCSTESASCTTVNGCEQATSCLFGSGCYFDDNTCLETACAGVQEPTSDGLTAFENVVTCTVNNCQEFCPVFSDEPVGGTGGAGGEAGGPPLQPCDTCEWPGDGFCDDGSQGGMAFCELGTDCTDCGGVPPAP